LFSLSLTYPQGQVSEEPTRYVLALLRRRPLAICLSMIATNDQLASVAVSDTVKPGAGIDRKTDN
jgi:hypothetical protein